MHTIEIETEHQVKKVEQHGNNPGADDKPAVLELTTIKHNDDKDTPVVTKPKVSKSISRVFSQDDDEESRPGWSNQCDFFLSALGYAVGLGNVWRFPYLVFKNGGGTFLVPYFIMLFLVGLPMYFMELAIAQYSGLGPTRIFGRMAPIFKGLGFSMIAVVFMVNMYYNMIIAWSIFYLFAGMRSELPWTGCEMTDCSKGISSDRCFDPSKDLVNFNGNCIKKDENGTYANILNCTGDCHNNDPFAPNGLLPSSLSTSQKFYCFNKSWTPSEDYFNTILLGVTPGCLDPNDSATCDWFNSNFINTTMNINKWSNFGEMHWELVMCLLAAWIIVGLALSKGVQSSGKVVYFTAIFPFVVLFIFFVYGLTLDGMEDGISLYLKPDIAKLKDIKVWVQAATQIFYSLGPCFGGVLTLASYNNFNNNCHRDAILIAVCNSATSIFAGFVVFSILGSQSFTSFMAGLRHDIVYRVTSFGRFMAKQMAVPVEDVVGSGPSLAFVAFPYAMSRFPFSPPLMSFLFFFMLLTLGLDSMFAGQECVITAILDHFKALRKHKEYVVAGTCFAGFLLGLVFCSSGGIFIFTLIDDKCATWNVLLFALIECIIVAWLYGTEEFFDNIDQMGMKLHNRTLGWKAMYWYWYICWKFITPAILTFLIIYSIIDFGDSKYEDYIFEYPVQIFGWIITLTSVILLPTLGAWNVYKRHRAGKPMGMNLLKPTKKWRPALGARIQQKSTDDILSDMAIS